MQETRIFYRDDIENISSKQNIQEVDSTGYNAWNDQKLSENKEMIPKNVRRINFILEIIEFFLIGTSRCGLVHNSIHSWHTG